MFAVVITEKGGAQRRMDFDKNEVTIGRVQGNDVILPKGNVSKRHSRIVLKDNRFIVVDLKSTNGTYVNGRKITSPLVVKPGDKIYIGDFILTVEEEAGAGAQPEGAAPPPPPQSGPPQASEPPAPPPGAQEQPAPARAAAPPPLPSQRGGPSGATQRPSKPTLHEEPAQAPAPPQAPAQASAPVPESEPSERFPLEQEPSDESPAPEPRVAPSEAEALPSEPAPPPQAAQAQAQAQAASAAVPAAPQPAAPPPAAPAGGPELDHNLGPLMARLAQAFDVHDVSPASLHDMQRREQAQQVIQGTIGTLQGEGQLDQNVDAAQLAGAALREAVGLGALEPLLQDDGIREIVIEGPSRIVVDRGEGFEAIEGGFSSMAGLLTVARRLVAQAGVHLDAGHPVVQTVLPYGPHVTVVLPPVAVQGPVIEIRRVGHAASAEELLSRGMLSSEMLEVLRRAVDARRNILVMGPIGSGVTTVLGALASAANDRERIVTIEETPDLKLGHDHVVSLSTSGRQTGVSLSEVMQQANRLRADRLVIDDVQDGQAFDALAVLAARGTGCLLGVHATTEGGPLDALRLLAQLDGQKPKDTLEGLLSRAVSVVVQTAQTADGPRIVAVSEVNKGKKGAELADLFVFDGSFSSTGTEASF